MKKLIYVTLILLPLFSRAQQIAWTQTINYSAGQSAKNIIFDSNNNLFMAGHFYESFNPDGTHGTYIHKYNTSGQLLWMDSVRCNGIPVSGGMDMDQNGNIYTSMARPASLTGSTVVWINGTQYPGGFGYLIKYNSNGQIAWVSNIGQYHYPLSTSVDNAGNILVTGHTGNNCFTKKFNASGVLLSTYNICGTSLALDHQNNMFFAEVDSVSQRLSKYNSSGSLLWSHNMNAPLFKICPDKNGNIFALTCNPQANSLLLKLSPNGNVIWSKQVPYEGCNLSCDDNYLYVIENTPWSKGRAMLEVIKYDFSGNILWNYRVPDSWDLKGSGVLNHNGSYYISARGNEVLNAYLMRLDPTDMPTAINQNEIRTGISIYPNPAKLFNLNCRVEGKQNLSLKVFDVTGRCVMEKTYDFDGELSEQLDMSAYSKGVYQLLLALNNQQAVRRLVVE